MTVAVQCSPRRVLPHFICGGSGVAPPVSAGGDIEGDRYGDARADAAERADRDRHRFARQPIADDVGERSREYYSDEPNSVSHKLLPISGASPKRCVL